MPNMTEPQERELSSITLEIVDEYRLYTSRILSENFVTIDEDSGVYRIENRDYEAVRNLVNGLWYLTGDYTYNE